MYSRGAHSTKWQALAAACCQFGNPDLSPVPFVVRMFCFSLRIPTTSPIRMQKTSMLQKTEMIKLDCAAKKQNCFLI
jgi:hypothetical protein